jgi:hypothetical protein
MLVSRSFLTYEFQIKYYFSACGPFILDGLAFSALKAKVLPGPHGFGQDPSLICPTSPVPKNQTLIGIIGVFDLTQALRAFHHALDDTYG